MDIRPLLITQFDSACPQGLASIIHVLRSDGRMMLEVLDGDVVRSTLPLMVVPQHEATRPAESTLTLDLAAVVEGRAFESNGFEKVGAQEPLAVAEGGSLQISSSLPRTRRRAAGYSARLRGNGMLDRTPWSTAALNKGDLFALVPLRPGRYQLGDEHRGRSCAVVVRYPDPREPARDLPPVVRQAEDDGDIVLACGQGLVLVASHGSRFKMNLVSVDDGPADLAAWKAEQDRSFFARRQS